MAVLSFLRLRYLPELTLYGQTLIDMDNIIVVTH